MSIRPSNVLLVVQIPPRLANDLDRHCRNLSLSRGSHVTRSTAVREMLSSLLKASQPDSLPTTGGDDATA